MGIKLCIELETERRMELKMALFILAIVESHCEHDSQGQYVLARKIAAIKIVRAIPDTCFGLKEAKDIVEFVFANRVALHALSSNQVAQSLQ
jgi:ribosomal protein L7/L12